MRYVALLVLVTGYGMAQESPVTNHYDPNEAIPKLTTEQAWLYQPESEWTYSHHPSIAWFNGKYYAMWSNGRVDEDAPGQRVLYASSEDFLHWTEPRVLAGPVHGKHSEVVLTASGFHVSGEQLTAYFGQYEYKQERMEGERRKPGDKGHEDTGLWTMTSANGSDWTKPVSLGIPVVPNHPPQKTHSGRLIIAANIAYPYTDDKSGLTGWKMTGIYPKEMENILFDDSEGFGVVKERMNWPVGLCEGSFFQRDDGTIVMLLRSGTPWLWVTESRDDGVTWSAPVPTAFSDDRAKFHCGSLPDGRFYHVGNTKPGGGRNPLVLSLSNDGVNFARHFIIADQPFEMKRQGMHKGGVYGYPHTLVRDNHLHVIVSICKEAVTVFRIPLTALTH